MLAHFRRLLAAEDGTMLIETAIVTPVLLMMSLGAFDVSRMVARQSELQSAVAEASAVALSSSPKTADQRATLKSVIVTSTGLPDSGVSVDPYYRCGSDSSYVTDKTTCGSNKVTDYVRISLTQTYAPLWTKFGVDKPMNFNVVRYVLLSQEV